MDSNLNNLSNKILEQLYTDGSGYDILRYIVLPELLGLEKKIILYFMGKNIARKFSFETIEEIQHAFRKLGCGKLELVKERYKSDTFQLIAQAVDYRIRELFVTEFRLESGFLAESMQQIERTECECVEKVNKRLHQVELKVILTI